MTRKHMQQHGFQGPDTTTDQSVSITDNILDACQCVHVILRITHSKKEFFIPFRVQCLCVMKQREEEVLQTQNNPNITANVIADSPF